MTPSEFSEHTAERDVVLVLHHRHVGVMNARSCAKRMHAAFFRGEKLFARDLQRALEATYTADAVPVTHERSACHAKPRNGARLRARLDDFFGWVRLPKDARNPCVFW